MTSSSSTTPKAPLAVYGGIAVCSAAVLMQEIILTRVFSFTIWYHLAYLTISTALLGFGAAGSLLAGVGWLGRISGRTLSAWGAAGAAVSLLVSAVILGPRPLDPLELVTHPASFSLGLLGYYIVITLPFLFAGLAIVSPLRAYPDEVNRLYAADLFGAGLGCLGAVLSLKFAPAPVAIILCALLFATSAVLYAARDRQALACAVLTATILAISPLYARYLTFMPAPSKAMGDHIRRPGTVIEYTKWSPINRVDVYSMANPHLTFWAGIGRGEGYKGPVPAGLSLQYDAHNGSAIYSNENPDAFELLDTHLLRLPYLLKDTPEVLVIGVGGGVDIYNAFRRGSKHVTAVELQPITVDLLTKNESVREYTRDYFLRPDLNLVASEGRH